MPTAEAKFNGLADNYDRARPRYTAALFAHAVGLLPDSGPPVVVDVGGRNRDRPGGVCAVVQNNRDHEAGGFASEYEDLLEEFSPGYRRDYRAIDVAGSWVSGSHTWSDARPGGAGR
ncbi:hypothetical protein ACWIG5_19295 [Streptomyces lydicus]